MVVVLPVSNVTATLFVPRLSRENAVSNAASMVTVANVVCTVTLSNAVSCRIFLYGYGAGFGRCYPHRFSHNPLCLHAVIVQRFVQQFRRLYRTWFQNLHNRLRDM